MSRFANSRGVTLIELLIILAIIGIITGLAGLGMKPYITSWQVRNAANQVYDDLQKAQQTARQIGNYSLSSSGLLIEKRVFWVFDTAAGSYEVLRWQDEDGDGSPDAGETDSLFSVNLADGVEFGMVAGVTRTACGDDLGAPSAEVTFSVASYPPCNGNRCIRFNKFGFSEIGVGGGIYLTRGDVSYALTLTKPGNIAICRWDGNHWRLM